MKRTLRIRCALALVFVAVASWLATAYWFGRDVPVRIEPCPSNPRRTLSAGSDTRRKRSP